MENLQTESPEILSPQPSTPKKKILIFLSLFFLVLLGGAVYLNKTNKRIPVSEITKSPLVTDATPTPFPFQEMTIPYLRSQTYASTLSDLEEVGRTGEYISYVTSYQSDGLRINGLLTKPVNDMPKGGYPAIVFVHGYIPPTNYQTTGQQYASYVDFLARRGFVVFKIDLRGHGESEGEPGGAYYSSDYITDVLHAYSALQNTDMVNKEKIGLWGHSMAGNVLLRAFVTKPDIPAVVIWAGAVYTYTDMREYGIQDNSYQPLPTNSQRANRRQQLFNTYGQVDPENEFWKQVIPVNYLSEVQGALQLHHAVDDTVVSVEYSRGLKKILEETTIPHEVVEYPSGGHNVSGSSFTQAMEKTVEFYNQYLQ